MGSHSYKEEAEINNGSYDFLFSRNFRIFFLNNLLAVTSDGLGAPVSREGLNDDMIHAINFYINL